MLWRPLSILLACALVAGPARAAAPSDLSADPLDRATLLALPSIYRVTVTLRVDALTLSDGSRRAVTPRARNIPEVGTAFAAAPGGWLVTAAHLAAPDGPTIARLAYQNDLAYRGLDHGDEQAAADWVTENGARPVGGVTSITVRQADAGGGIASSRAFRVLDVMRSPSADLALIHIDAQAAPALALDPNEATTSGTPVVTLGYGRTSALQGTPQGDLEPAVRRGRLGRSATLLNATPERQALQITVPVERGDSGGPVVDGAGRVRGVVIIRNREGGVAENATEVRQLLASADLTSSAGSAGDLFREGMEDLWRLDFTGAQRSFADTLAVFPDHTLAPIEATRATALAAGHYRLSGRRRSGLLVAIAIVALVGALACAVGLARVGLGRSGKASEGR